MQRAVSVVCLALSLIGRSQQKQYIMFYNTVILAARGAIVFLGDNRNPSENRSSQSPYNAFLEAI
jgi:hypothetical protein